VGGVVGAAGVVAWASASVTVKSADEATTPNAVAHPRKASALRRQTGFGFERSVIVRLPVCCPAEHVTNVESLVIDLDQLGSAVQAKLEFSPADDGARSDDQSACEFVSRKILSFCLRCKGIG
jgi:hypothetical protein